MPVLVPDATPPVHFGTRLVEATESTTAHCCPPKAAATETARTESLHIRGEGLSHHHPCELGDGTRWACRPREDSSFHGRMGLHRGTRCDVTSGCAAAAQRRSRGKRGLFDRMMIADLSLNSSTLLVRLILINVIHFFFWFFLFDFIYYQNLY